VIDVAQAELLRQLNGYPGLPEHGRGEFLVSALLGGMAGPAGTLILAEDAALSVAAPANLTVKPLAGRYPGD
jgi:fructokinase